VKNFLKVLGFVVLGITFFSTNATADIAKGQKIFIKKYKKSCGFNGGVMAKKHTQKEWKEIYDSGKLNDELLKQCPKAKEAKEKYLKHMYDFFFNYASDSGNVPSC
jgi:hypothetical protein